MNPIVGMLGDALRSAGIGIWEWDTIGDRLTLDGTALRLHGLSSAQAPSDSAGWLLCIHPEDRPRVVAEISAARAGVDFRSRFRIQLPDGSVRFIEADAVADRCDAPTRLLGTLRDSSALEQAERKWLESERRYSRSIELPGFIGWKTRADGQIEDMPVWRKFTGQTVEEVKGWGWLSAMHPGDQARTAAVWQRAVETKSLYETEYRVRRHDGVYLDFMARGIPLIGDEGEIVEWVGVCIDISERKRAEEELLRTTNRLLLATRAAAIGIWDWDIPKDELFYDDAMYALYGLRREDFGGAYEAWVKALHPQDAPRMEAAIQSALRGDKEYNEEFRIIRPDGEVRFIQAAGQTFRDADGKPLRMVGTNLDITERRRTDEELKHYRDHLEDLVKNRTLELEKAKAIAESAQFAADAANRAKSAFLANMSHELRTPLNAILGYSQMMMRGRAPDAPDADTLRIINRSGEHLLGLINSVLDLAKIESHKYTLESEDFDLGQFLLEIADILRRRAEDKGISLAVDQSSSFPRYVRADRNKLRQVLINIVGNAIKFTEIGGVTLKLTTGGGLGSDNKGELVFTVTDTGPGIHPEDMERIFRPFEQAKHRSNVEGTGLGLPLARELVRLMGGDVRVESEVGRGSTFVFDITFTPVDEAGLDKIQAPPPGDITGIEGAPGLRVLIVEDHFENRALLRKIIAQYGFDVAEAENGEIGVRLAAEWKPHLVLMDRRMPVMDGVTATRRIRELPEGAKIKISAVTAEAFNEDYASMMEAGCDAFLRKPYRIEEILTTVAALLPVTLVRAEPAAALPVAGGDEALASAARAAFAKLPSEAVVAVRAACAAADTERVAELLAPYPESAVAGAPFLKSFRTDRLATFLPE